MSFISSIELSSKRDSLEDVQRDQKLVASNLFVNTILNSLPVLSAIVNECRQIVFINDMMSNFLNAEHSTQCFGKRPGELIGCVNSNLSINGCGHSEFCGVCGAVATVIESQRSGKTVSGEAHIRVRGKSGEEVMECNVTAIPLPCEGKKFTLITMQDLSARNRRKVLERIFFHDVMNYAAAVLNAMDLLNDNLEENKDLVPLLRNVAHLLFEEIDSQKVLILAENDELTVSMVPIEIDSLIKSTVDLVSMDSVYECKYLKVLNSQSFTIVTDQNILKRVIVNLLKNALEASGLECSVKVNYGVKGKDLFITVQNDGVMTNDVYLQIFQKSFSTKGEGRGVGTFSVKLMTERYLGGTVTFESNEQVGTVFTVLLPYNN